MFCFMQFASNQNPFMTYHRFCNNSNTTVAICGAETTYHSVHLNSHPVFSEDRVARSDDSFPETPLAN